LLQASVFAARGFFFTWISERPRMVQMQGGNKVAYPGVISTDCQRSRCAVLGRPAERRRADRKTLLL